MARATPEMRPLVAGELGVRDVRRVEDRLRREQRERLEQRELVGARASPPRAASLLEELVRALERADFGECLLVAGLGGALHAVEPLLHGREIGERELELDDFAIAHGIDGAHHVQDVVVIEAANDVHDGVGLADVREELVAEPLALARAGDEAGDVDELDCGSQNPKTPLDNKAIGYEKCYFKARININNSYQIQINAIASE